MMIFRLEELQWMKFFPIVLNISWESSTTMIWTKMMRIWIQSKVMMVRMLKSQRRSRNQRARKTRVPIMTRVFNKNLSVNSNDRETNIFNRIRYIIDLMFRTEEILIVFEFHFSCSSNKNLRTLRTFDHWMRNQLAFLYLLQTV